MRNEVSFILKLKSIFIILIAILSFQNERVEASRYVLMEVLKSQDGKKSTGVYLDNYEQELVTQEVRWSKDFSEDLQESGKKIYEFPKSTPTLGQDSRKELRYGIDVKYKKLDLDHWAGRRRTRKKLSSIGDQEFVDKMMTKSTALMSKGDGRFELIKSVHSGKVTRAVYYNPVKGEYAYKSMKSEESEKYPFPQSIAMHIQADIFLGKGKFKNLRNENYLARTPWQLANAARVIQKKFNYKISGSSRVKSEIFLSHLNKIYKKMDDFVLVREFQDPNSKEKIEAWYNTKTNKLIYRRFNLKKNGEKDIREEMIYALNDLSDFEKAIVKFEENDLFTENDIESFRDSLPRCDNSLTAYLNEEPTQNASNIVEAVYDEHINGALPKRPIRLGKKSLLMKVKLLGESHPIKLRFDDNGDLTQLNWANKQTALGSGLMLSPKEKGIDGRHFHSIHYKDPNSGDLIPLMEFSTYRFGLGGKDEATKLSVRVRGKRKSGMDFSGSEVSTYDLGFDESRSKIMKIGKRYRFKGQRRDPFDFEMKSRKKSSLKNAVFKNFYSDKRKLKKIRKIVKKEAEKTFLDKDSSFAGLISKKEIENISIKVANITKKRTNNFRDSLERTQAVASEEAYKAFTPILLRNTLSDLLPEEKRENLDEVIEKLMTSFKGCLKRSTKAESLPGSNSCMEAFTREGPVGAGREILALKLRQAGMKKFIPGAKREYESCIEEYYDPIYSKKEKCVRKRRDIRDWQYEKCLQKKIDKNALGLDRIKSCLYTGFLKTLNVALPPTMDAEVEKVSAKMGVSYELSAKDKKRGIEKIGSCLEKKGLAQYDAFGKFRTNITELDKIDPAVFEQDLFTCGNTVIVEIGRSLAKVGVKDKLKDVEGISKKDKEDIAKTILSEGYDECTRTLTHIRDSKIELQRNKKDEKNVKIPDVDPKECVRHLTNLGVGRSAERLISNMVGAEKFKRAQNNKDEFIGCFLTEHARLLINLPEDLNNTSENEKERNDTLAQREKVSDANTAKCLKKGIHWASGDIAVKLVKEKLASNPNYSKILITAENEKMIKRKIESCFKNGLSSLNTVNDIMKDQKVLSDKCGASLLKDKEIQTILFDPIIKDSLKGAKLNLSIEKEDRLIKKLKEDLNKSISDKGSVEAVLEEATAFSDGAVRNVVDFILEDKIQDVFSEDPERAQQVYAKVNSKLFSEKNSKLEKRLIDAFKKKDDKDLKKIVNEIGYKSADIIAPEVITKEVDGLIKKGIFEDREDAFLSQEYLEKEFKNCFDLKKQRSDKTLDEKIKICEKEVKNAGTAFVLRDRLRKSLACQDIVYKSITKKTRGSGIPTDRCDYEKEIATNSTLNRKAKELEEKIITEERLREIKNINNMDDEKKVERSARFSLFVTSFEADAVKEVFQEIIPSIISNAYKIPESATIPEVKAIKKEHKEIIDFGKREIDSCAEEVKQKAKLAYEKKENKVIKEKASEYCVNKVRLSITKRTLGPLLATALTPYLEKGELSDAIEKKAVDSLSLCSKKISLNQKGFAFEARLNACLNKVVFDIINLAINELRSKKLLKKSDLTKSSIKECKQNIRLHAFERVHGKSSNKKIPKKLEKLFITDFYTKLNLDAYPNKEKALDLEWLKKELVNCLSQKLSKAGFKEVIGGTLRRKGDKISGHAKETIDLFIDSAAEVIGTKNHTGKSLSVDISPLRKASKKRGRINGQRKTYLSQFREIEDKIIPYLNLISDYDPSRLQNEMKRLKEKLKTKAYKSDGKLELEDIADVVLETEVSDVIIESIISDLVKKEVKNSLEKEGVRNAEEIAEDLSSKDFINKLFGSGDGKKLINKIKKEHLRPILLGGKNLKAPKSLIKEAKLILANDTSEDGFADRIAGAVLQHKMDNLWFYERVYLNVVPEDDWDEVPFYKKRVRWNGARVGWNGAFATHDFTWGSPKSGKNNPKAKYDLRKTPSGKRIVKLFSKKILTPKLTGDLSKEDEKKATKEMITLLQKAQSENPKAPGVLSKALKIYRNYF